MKYQLVLIAMMTGAFTAGTRGRLLGKPKHLYDNDLGGSGGGGDLVDDEDYAYEGSGGHDDFEVSGRVHCSHICFKV